jgi:hypothetical protein
VWRLAAAIFDIAIHRRGPEELPASRFLFSLLLGLYLIVGVISLSAFGLYSEADLIVLLIDCAFFLAYVFVTLRLFGHERRFIQTGSALLGTDIVLSLIGLPLSFWTRDVGTPEDQISIALILRILIPLWWIDVAGFIFGRALGRPYAIGLVFVILYVAVSLNIRDLLAPAT